MGNLNESLGGMLNERELENELEDELFDAIVDHYDNDQHRPYITDTRECPYNCMIDGRCGDESQCSNSYFWIAIIIVMIVLCGLAIFVYKKILNDRKFKAKKDVN